MTAKTWTPPPKMPDNLPPLPMGRNGRTLVYLGAGQAFETPSIGFEGFMTSTGGSWGKDIWNGQSDGCHYAAESDSEVCRLNGWGDYTPEAQKEQVKAAQTSMIEEWQKAATAARVASEMRFADLSTALSVEAKHLAECRETEAALHGDSVFIRRAWYEQGRKDERHHAKVRTNFPLYP